MEWKTATSQLVDLLAVRAEEGVGVPLDDGVDGADLDTEDVQVTAAALGSRHSSVAGRLSLVKDLDVQDKLEVFLPSNGGRGDVAGRQDHHDLVVATGRCSGRAGLPKDSSPAPKRPDFCPEPRPDTGAHINFMRNFS